VLTFENTDDIDYQMLQTYATNAVSSFTKHNESDDGLLPVKYTQIHLNSKKSPGEKGKL
jgi:hypothetical protein